MNAQSSAKYEVAAAGRKRALLGGLHGDVLEIGPGDGPNLRYFAPDVRWVGVEPNPYMHPYLQRTIASLRRAAQSYRIETGDPAGRRLPAGDASVDAVVSTLVLCSVDRPEEMLREILRVLKPGGKFVFLEHVAAQPGTRMRWWQDFLTPAWAFTSDGCHPNRETWVTIAQAGFGEVQLEHFIYPDGWLASPHIVGIAVKD